MAITNSVIGNSHPHAVDDLIHMIDQHVAFSLGQENHFLCTKASKGTMFVDFDGTSVPRVSYRNHLATSFVTPETASSQYEPRRDSIFEDQTHARSTKVKAVTRVPYPPLATKKDNMYVKKTYGPRGEVHVQRTELEFEYDQGERMAPIRQEGREYSDVDTGAYVREWRHQQAQAQAQVQHQHRQKHHQRRKHPQSHQNSSHHNHSRHAKGPIIHPPDKSKLLRPTPPSSSHTHPKFEKLISFFQRLLRKISEIGVQHSSQNMKETRQREKKHKKRREVRREAKR
jgi:hypothetical protein